jgi:hypothetical protein
MEWWCKKYYGHTSTHLTPFEVVYGEKTPSILSYMLGVSNVEEIGKNLIVCKLILHTLKENLAMAHNHMNKKEE